MALDPHIKNNVVGKLTLKDGTGTPVTLDVPFYAGDLTIDGLSAVLNETLAVKARGQILGKLYGEAVQPAVAFSAYIAEMTNATAGVFSDFVFKKGAYASNISTGGTGRPYTIHVAVHLEGTSFGGNDVDFELKHYAPTGNYATAIDGDKISLSGVCDYITGDLAMTQVSP